MAESFRVLHLATISVLSSYCSFGLKVRTSSTTKTIKTSVIQDEDRPQGIRLAKYLRSP